MESKGDLFPRWKEKIKVMEGEGKSDKGEGFCGELPHFVLRFRVSVRFKVRSFDMFCFLIYRVSEREGRRVKRLPVR